MTLLDDLTAPLGWQRDALCAEPAYEALPWFPEKGETTSAAKAVCGRCTVRPDCLAYAVAHGIDTGIWGGMSPKERRRAS